MESQVELLRITGLFFRLRIWQIRIKTSSNSIADRALTPKNKPFQQKIYEYLNKYPRFIELKYTHEASYVSNKITQSHAWRLGDLSGFQVIKIDMKLNHSF